MSLRKSISCIGLLFGALLWGCGGRGSGGGGSAAEVQYGKDLATIDSVNAYLNTQSTLGRADLAQAAIAYLKKNPSFVNPGISADGSVYATLQDGVPFSIETNDPTIDLQAGPVRSTKALNSSGQRQLPTRGASRGLPEAGEAYVINGFPANCDSPAAVITAELQDAGYHVTSNAGMLNDWKAVSNAAILFNSSHGARLPDPKTGAIVFWQQSGQEPQKSDASWAQPLLDSGALRIDSIPDPQQSITSVVQTKSPMVKRYTFSVKFLTNPKMFAANSLFWDESCSGTSTEGKDFVTSLQQHNGLNVFAGWTSPMIIPEATESSLFFFDRALGLNRFPPVDSSSPPPNNWNSIWGIMQTTDRAVNPSLLLSKTNPSAYPGETDPIADLTLINGSGDLETIIPSIAATSKDTVNNVLTLTGNFGATQGTVNFGTSPLTVKSWTATSITTQLPTTGGDVQVVSPFKLLSNKVTLTGPSVISPPTVTFDGPGQSYTFTATGTFPSGTSYKWSCKSGTLSAPVTTVPRVTYTVANPPADGSSAQDTLSVQVVGSNGTVLASGSASIHSGGLPFLVATYPYAAANNKLTTAYIGNTNLTNLMGDPSFLGLFYEFEDHVGGFFGITVSVPSGTFLTPGQSYPLSATGNITQLDVFALQGAIVAQGPAIKSGTLTINSEIPSPAGNGMLIGYSFKLQYDNAPQCTANGVILQHS